MEYYDYREAIRNDLLEYYTIEELRDNCDCPWDDDHVTGNGGTYYDTEEACKKYLAGNLSLAIEAIENFDLNLATIINNKDHINQFLDCLIRCYLLGECVDELIEENE